MLWYWRFGPKIRVPALGMGAANIYDLAEKHAFRLDLIEKKSDRKRLGPRIN
jgi:hypothetical protein